MTNSAPGLVERLRAMLAEREQVPKRPTIAELEAILAAPQPDSIKIMPDGSIIAGERREAEAATIREAAARIEALEKALRSAGEKFREYEQMHRDKLPLNTAGHEAIAEKVARNREMAEMCETALAESQP